MLEKIGLPERPSMRGNNWVIDASHCQGCSSPFTFINRKHHCRRCGGLFCGTCTQQRMVLRGQGDSPVRICDPCKKLEEAARFELRHGIKKKAARGGSKLISRNEDEVLEQILSSELISSKSNASGSSSSSVLQEHATRDNVDEKGLSLESGPTSPEELRQQAVEEKNKYKTLRAEGKPEEALKAFKRGKELERQAGALELSLRKNRRKASSLVNTVEIQNTDGATSSSGRKNELNLGKTKGKDDISSELKELGWSDMDLHDAEKKPAPMSLEGELFSLLGEVSQKSGSGNASRGIDKTQVLALKKQALALKREGKLGEAKEKLKEAKILEKQLEEQEFLGEDEESEDELSALIRGMDNDKHDDVAVNYQSGPGFNFNQLLNDDIGVDGNFEVTDEDLYDPEMDAALKSLGWDDYTSDHHEDREATRKKAKLPEKELNSSSSLSEKPLKQYEDEGISVKLAPKSRLMIQKELLGIKKTALALRREGKSSEADEELRKGKVLEQQLEEMNNVPNVKDKAVHVSRKHEESIPHSDIGDEVEADVTDNDMQDPAYLGLLKNLGWDEEDDKNASIMKIDPPCAQAENSLPRRSKGEIQRELLGLKRKALTLRRQGQNEEAEETQKMAKVLEAQLEEMEIPQKMEVTYKIQNILEDDNSVKKEDNVVTDNLTSNERFQNEIKEEVVPRDKNRPDIIQSAVANNEQSSLREQILNLKRNAFALKKKGYMTEAKEELRKAKFLEKALDENSSDQGASSSSTPNVAPVEKDENNSSPSKISKPVSSRDRFKLQQESLGLKRLSRKLRMEGRNEEADAEFEKAKAIEAQLEQLADKASSSGSKPVEDVAVEDFLDPQLLSALRGIGIDDSNTDKTQIPDKIEPPKKSIVKGENSANERAQLEEQIKAEKVKAVALKRSGKQAEALDALRRAKMFEKKLNSISS